MPVYSCKVRGSGKRRIVRAKSAAQARDHIVEAEPMSAEQLADEVGKGTAIEVAGAPEPAAEDTDGEPGK